MKNVKKIVCGGLAFTDKEDMEMLHRYASDGWIFKEFKGLRYHLYKEEPRDIIYDYDMLDLSKEEEEEYLEMAYQQGWYNIPVSRTNKGIYFFWAEKGTRGMHTDRDIEASRYQPIYKVAIQGLLLGIVGVVCGVTLLSGILQMIVLGVSGGLIGGTSVLAIGSWFRTKKKRVRIMIRFKPLIIMSITSLFIFTLNYFHILIPSNPIILIVSLVFAIFFGICAILQFGQYRDRQEIK